jgi:hypothetical protein
MLMSRDTNLGEGLTVGQVSDLRDEAGQAGDMAIVATCDDALEHDVTALRKIVEVLNKRGG